MPKRVMQPTADTIDPSAPLRLDVAAKIAFPDGSMTASGLRREGSKGRLTLERIANKDYTTLDAIRAMRELCRVQAKGSDSIRERPDIETENSFTRRSGSSKMEIAISPQDALRARLNRDRPKRPSKP